MIERVSYFSKRHVWLRVWAFCMSLSWFAVSADAAPVEVAVSIPPQAFLVERLAGAFAHVVVMMPPGSSHESYTPTPRQMMALADAPLYVAVGHPHFAFEAHHIFPLLAKQPKTKIINTTTLTKNLASDAKLQDDPHLWTAPRVMEMVAREIAVTLAQIDPAHTRQYENNLQQLLAEIDELDRSIVASWATAQGYRVYVYHSAWAYLASQYGFEQVALENGDKAPSPERLVTLMRAAQRQGVKVIYVEKGVSPKSAVMFANEIHAEVLELDPIGYDWLANTRHVAQALRRGAVP